MISGLWAFLSDIAGWLRDRLVDFWNLPPAVKVSALQLVALVIAGIWAFRLYLLRRQGETSIRVEAAVRLSKRRRGETILFFKVHVINPSAVRVRYKETSLLLLDASGRDSEGEPTWGKVWKKEPFLEAVGGAKDSGKNMVVFERASPWLEPGECLETEVAYSTFGRLPNLMAVRLSFRDIEGRFRQKENVWSTFGFVDPSFLRRDYTPIAFGGVHAGP